MLSLLLVVLSAPPPAPPLPGDISAPFGHYGAVVAEAPKGGATEADRAVVPAWEGCEAQGVYLVRALSGTIRALEQLQQSLDAKPGVEKKLFARKAVLTDVLRHLSGASFSPKAPCTASPLLEGYRLDLAAAPKKWCEAKASQDGEFWFFTQGRAAAVVSVQPGAEASRCKPRLSVTAFDSKGAARVRVHADWGGAVTAALVGDRCQVIDYLFDPGRQVLAPAWKSCKR